MMLLARASIGLWLWATGFSLLYALHGAGCARGWDRLPLGGGTWFQWMMIGAWLALIAAGAAVVWRAGRAAPGLERRLSMASAAAGLAATIITGSPVVMASSCI